MSYFKHHVFFCCNQRENGEGCCNDFGASDLQMFAKSRVGELGLNGPGQVRINKAGCLGRCEEGPVAVVYPEGVWYRYVDKEDIEEIIQKHLVGGEVVVRLKVDSDSPV